jgi:hypothetical protein
LLCSGEEARPDVLPGYLPELQDLPDALPDRREKVPVGAANLGR